MLVYIVCHTIINSYVILVTIIFRICVLIQQVSILNYVDTEAFCDLISWKLCDAGY